MTHQQQNNEPDANELAAALESGLPVTGSAAAMLRRQAAELEAVGAGGMQQLSPQVPALNHANQAQAATKSIARGGKISRHSEMSVLVTFPSCRQASVFEQAIQGEAPPGSGGWQAHAEAMERERDHWLERARTMHEHQRGDVWYWQGDGCDNLQSLVNSLPVVIRADQLRQLVAGGVQALSAGPVGEALRNVFDSLIEDLEERAGRTNYPGNELYVLALREAVSAIRALAASPTPPAEQPAEGQRKSNRYCGCGMCLETDERHDSGCPKAKAQPGAVYATFEAWAKAEGGEFALYNCGPYNREAMTLAGMAWRASHALRQAAPKAALGEPVDLDRVLGLADVHAEDSREDGVRLLDRGGLFAFARDILRIFGRDEAPQQAAPQAAPAVDAVLSYLDALKDDAAAHIYPDDLQRCATSECTATVYSVRVGSPDGKTVPLFSREQVAEALAARRGGA